MKKTVTININGIIFNIDEDAYEALQQYISSIREHFKNSKGCDEIIFDIEARISEVFSEKINDGKLVITIEDVTQLINLMGRPEEIADVNEEQDDTENDEKYKAGRRQKRIYRDTDHQVLGGVCSGLGHYIGVDPVWLRIFFILFFFGMGSGFLVYIIMWIVIPEAKTSAEKLEMRGEPVNIGNIGKNIEKEMNNIRDKFHEVDGKKHIRSVGSFLSRILDVFVNIIVFFFKTFGKILGVIFLFAGAILLTVFLYSIFDSSNIISSFTPDGANYFSWSDLTQIMFTENDQTWLATVGIILLIGIPLFSIVYSGFKLLFNIRNDWKIAGIILSSMFLAGMIMCIIVGLQIGKDFSFTESSSYNIHTNNIKGDTLSLVLTSKNYIGDKKIGSRKRSCPYIENSQLYLGPPRVDIIASESDSFNIRIIKSAKGENKKDAYLRAKHIRYPISIRDNHIFFNPCYSINLKDRWRSQELKVIIEIPEGKTVFPGKGMGKILYDVQNVSNTLDKDMAGHYWKVDSGTLTCPNNI